MPHLQIKNVTKQLHAQLKSLAKTKQCTLSELMLEVLKKELAKQRWQEKWNKLPTHSLGMPAAALINAERRGREKAH